jgi:hypothetical protein
MTSINKWRIYCNTENDWSYGLLDSTDSNPTTCFNNSSHSVNPVSPQITQIISTTTIKASIEEETTSTGGNFRAEAFKFTIAANFTNNLSISWKYPISVLSTFFTTCDIERGNIINSIVAPSTLIGVLTQDAAIGNVTFNVNFSVIQNIKIGYDLLINSIFIGQVIAVGTGSVTVDNTSTIAFSAGTHVQTQVHEIINYEIDYPCRYVIGSSKIGGKYLPANTLVHVSYQNNSIQDITFRFQIEYLY